jgi:glycosyltransferase involved in cell wall biosynthesis
LLTLVRAFEQVVQKYEERLQLVIAGKRGWLVDDLYAYVKASPAQKQIIFTGYVSEDRLKALYSSCTVFVYPSMYEGFGLPPLEAMKCGAPVVATKMSSVAEVVNSAARLVEPSVDSLTKAILELLNDDGLRESLKLAGRQRAAQFSWSETARQVRDVYREACERYLQAEKKG